MMDIMKLPLGQILTILLLTVAIAGFFAAVKMPFRTPGEYGVVVLLCSVVVVGARQLLKLRGTKKE